MERILDKIRTFIKIMWIKILYGKSFIIGKKIGISKGFNVKMHKGSNIRIGNDVFFNNYCSLNSLGHIEIGNHCIFGEGVKIYDHNHKYKKSNVIIKEQGFSIGKVSIGDNCWVGSNVTILNNVKIGKNVVIGANCLIHKSIPDNSIVKNNSDITINNINP